MSLNPKNPAPGGSKKRFEVDGWGSILGYNPQKPENLTD